MEKVMHILVIDGQGGRIGRLAVEAVRQHLPRALVTAVGTNSIATGSMLKGGAQQSATGENAVVVCCRTADVIIGPLGIVIADSLLGEVTAKMATAVGQSSARKLLIPVNRCNNRVVGMPELSMSEILDSMVAEIKALAKKDSLC